VGLRVGAQGFARIALSDRLALLPRVTGIGAFYRAHAYNDVSGSALVGFEWRSGKDRINPSVGRTWRWYGGKVYARTSALAVDWLHPLGSRGQLLVHSGASRADYVRNDLQDGELYDASIGVERAVTKRFGLGLAASGYRQTARDPGYATFSAGFSTTMWQDLSKVTLIATASLSRLEGDSRLFIFTDRRREWLSKASLAATLRQFKVASFAPSVRLALERNRSSVGIYEYRRLAVEFGIARAF
jgi:hypothetical protein